MSQGTFFSEYELFCYDIENDQTELLYTYNPINSVNVPSISVYENCVYFSVNEAEGDWQIYAFDVITKELRQIRKGNPQKNYEGLVTIDVYQNYVAWYEFYDNKASLFYYQIDIQQILEFNQTIDIASPYWTPYFYHGTITYPDNRNDDYFIINQQLQSDKKISLQTNTTVASYFYMQEVFSWQPSFNDSDSQSYAYNTKK